MPLLWYRDTDGAFKPYAVPGDELSFTYYVCSQSVPTGTGWTRVATPSPAPTGNNAAAFGVGVWTAPTDGVWQLEHQAIVTGNLTIGLKMDHGTTNRIASSPTNGSGTSGCGQVYTLDCVAGTVVNFWVNHNSASAQTITQTITATRLRRFTPLQAVRAGTGEFVARAGDTMTGPLVLSSDPVLALGAATKQYADAKVVNALGSSQVAAPSQAAVQGAVDTVNAKTVTAGNGLTGGGAVSGNPVINVGAGAGISVAADTVSANMAHFDGFYFKITGGNVTGTVTIVLDNAHGLEIQGNMPHLRLHHPGVAWGILGLRGGGGLASRAPDNVTAWPMEVGYPGRATDAASVQYVTDVDTNTRAYVNAQDAALNGNLVAYVNSQDAVRWTRWSGSSAAYNAIAVKDPNTLYVIV